MKQNLFKIFAVLVFVISSTGADARCFSVKSCRSTGSPELKVDSIDYRSDLTRVYGRLIGTPHTSHRIDAIKLQPSGVYATDIDGIDMKRWFQWEDDGELPVEIDFPSMKPRQVLVIEATTPRGTAVWTIEGQIQRVVKRKNAGK